MPYLKQRLEPLADKIDQVYKELQDYFEQMIDISKAGYNAMVHSDEKLAKMLNSTMREPVGTDRFRDMTDLYTKTAGARFGNYLGNILTGGGNVTDLLQDFTKLPTDIIEGMGSFYMRNGKSYLNAMFEYDQKIRDANLALGNTDELSRNVQRNFTQGTQEIAKFGLFFEDIVQMQHEYNHTLGTARSLRQDEFDIIAKISQGTGLAVDSASETVAILERYGFSARNTIEAIESQVELSRKYGINSLQTLERTRDVIKTAQKFTFRDGVRGLSEMVAQAQTLRMDVGDTFKMMDNARGLEGAFEMATKLQMMGKDVDALRLNFLARNDPKQFQKEINSLMQGFGHLDRMGRLDLTPIDIDILREMSSITGQSIEDMKAQIVQQKKISQIRSEMRMISDEDAQFLANMSSMKDGKLVVQVAGGALKEIDDLVQKDIDALKRMSAQSLEQSAMQSQGLEKQRDVANTSAIASTLDNLDNIIANMDMLRRERDKGTQALIDKFGMAEKSARALASTFTAASGTIAKDAMNFTTNTALKSAVAIGQEIARGINLEITADDIRELKNGVMDTRNAMPSPTNNLGGATAPGNGVRYGYMPNDFLSSYSSNNAVVNEMAENIRSTMAITNEKLNKVADMMIKSAEKQNESIKRGFSEALQSVSGNWPIQTIKLLIDLQGREMNAGDVKKMLELYDQAKRSGTGN